MREAMPETAALATRLDRTPPIAGDAPPAERPDDGRNAPTRRYQTLTPVDTIRRRGRFGGGASSGGLFGAESGQSTFWFLIRDIAQRPSPSVPLPGERDVSCPPEGCLRLPSPSGRVGDEGNLSVDFPVAYIGIARSARQ